MTVDERLEALERKLDRVLAILGYNAGLTTAPTPPGQHTVTTMGNK